MSVGIPRQYDFAVLPSRRAPRCLLPLGDVRTTLEGFRIYTPYALRARILKSLVLQLVKTGGDWWARDRMVFAAEEFERLEALVRDLMGESQPVFALLLGTPGKYRKLTIQVMRPNGEILGYVKLPLTDPATGRVRQEAAVLERLSHVAALQADIPRVLYSGKWQDGHLLFQSPLQGSPGPNELTGMHVRFLQTLWSTQMTHNPGHVLLERVSSRWENVAPRLDSGWQGLGDQVLQFAERELAGVSIPCGITHGDFAPWNTRVSQGRLFVFDWEAAEWEAPVWWDIFHFHTQVASLLGKHWGRSFDLSKTPGAKGAFVLYILSTVCAGLEEAPDRPDGLEYRRRVLMRELSQKSETRN